MHDATLRLDDGRHLAYVDLGDPAGCCIFYFHGAPSSRLALVAFEQALAEHDLRVIAPDRPGYGGSSPRPGRSMRDWPDDVAALADHLGLDRFAVAGHSSGGPYAVGCAALLPERVDHAVVIAGVTDVAWPAAWEGYDALETALMRGTDEQAAVALAVERMGADGSGFLEATSLEAAPEDLAFLEDPAIADAMVLHLAEAFRQGVAGYAQDVFLQGRPWPFDPGAVRAPTLVVHGEADAMVPLAHSRHTAEVVPGAELVVVPGHGHLSITAELPRIFASFCTGR